jgi:hypothetical protein
MTQIKPTTQQISNAISIAFDAAAKATDTYLKNPDTYSDTWFPCGFAWIKIKPARGPVVKFLKDHGIGHLDDYAGGYVIYNPSGNATQSLYAKAEGAKAFMKSLEEANILGKATIKVETRWD